MIDEVRRADLEETTLLIECKECGSGYALRPATQEPKPSAVESWPKSDERWGAVCFVCGHELAGEPAAETIVSLYRRLCEAAAHCSARIRVQVPRG